MFNEKSLSLFGQNKRDFWNQSRKENSTIPLLGQCSRSDPTERVRDVCLKSLTYFDLTSGQASAIQQLGKSYVSAKKESQIEARKLIAIMIHNMSGGDKELRQLVKNEKSSDLKKYIDEQLLARKVTQ